MASAGSKARARRRPGQSVVLAISRCVGSPPRKFATRSWPSAARSISRRVDPAYIPPIPKEVMAGQSVPGQGWSTSTPAEAARRSIYVHVKRSLLVPIMATHDAADTDFSCPVRYTTTVPTQALGLLNGAFCNEQASLLRRPSDAGGSWRPGEEGPPAQFG